MGKSGLQHCSFTAIGSRKHNEDRFLALEDEARGAYLFAVADGMGGHRAGGAAAEACMMALRESWAGSDGLPDSPERLQRLLGRCHLAVRKLASFEERTPPQTTVAVLVATPSAVWSGHVGDTRVIHYSRAGLQARTRDHSVTESKLAAGRITEQQALRDPDLNMLTQALGGREIPRGSVQQWHPRRGDLMCLASDGAWSLLTDDDFLLLLESNQLRQAVSDLMARKLARAPAGQDNATVVMLRT